MNKYIIEPQTFLARAINATKYGNKPKTWKVSDKITINWQGVLPSPPENNSEATVKELQKISQLTKNITSEQIDLVKMVDKDPNAVFEKMIKRHGLDSHKEEFDKAWRLVKPIILNLKWQFNRARPYQLAEHYGLDIRVIETETHHTPSYPSGHTAGAAIMGYILAEHYPEHSTEIFNNIDLAGQARVFQGVHYPSDNDASMVITGALWQEIKYNL